MQPFIKSTYKLGLGHFRAEAQLKHLSNHLTAVARPCQVCAAKDNIFNIMLVAHLPNSAGSEQNLHLNTLQAQKSQSHLNLYSWGFPRNKKNIHLAKLTTSIVGSVLLTIAHLYYRRDRILSPASISFTLSKAFKVVCKVYEYNGNITVPSICHQIMAGTHLLYGDHFFLKLKQKRADAYNTNIIVDDNLKVWNYVITLFSLNGQPIPLDLTLINSISQSNLGIFTGNSLPLNLIYQVSDTNISKW